MNGGLLKEAAIGFKDDLSDYFGEWLSLIPKVLRFLWLTLEGLITLLLVPAFGPFILALYLWGERGWSKRLNNWQKVLFWLITVLSVLAYWVCWTAFSIQTSTR